MPKEIEIDFNLLRCYFTFQASTTFIMAKKAGRSNRVPLIPSSVKWTMFVRLCCSTTCTPHVLSN